MGGKRFTSAILIPEEHITDEVRNSAGFWDNSVLNDCSMLLLREPDQPTVADNWMGENGQQSPWFIIFGDSTRLQEYQAIECFCELLNNYKVSGGPDCLCWRDGSSTFIVKQCYLIVLKLRLKFFNKGVLRFPWNKVWVQETPSKVAFFIWLCVRDSVLTQANLQRRGFKLASKCIFCLNSVEDTNHLFYSCTVTTGIWNYFCNTISRKKLLAPTLKDRFMKWKACNLSPRGATLWNLIPHAICWMI